MKILVNGETITTQSRTILSIYSKMLGQFGYQLILCKLFTALHGKFTSNLYMNLQCKYVNNLQSD